MKKKILALFIVLAQLMSALSLAYAVSPADDGAKAEAAAEKSKYEKTVKALDFFGGVEADAEVSFRDFCTFLFALKGTDVSGLNDAELMQSASAHDFIYSVSTVKQKADDPIYIEEALFGAVNALGYGTMTKDGGHVTRAAQLKLTDGISVSKNTALKGEQAFRLAYNMFDADYLIYTGQGTGGAIYEARDGVGILERELDIYNAKGTVTANEITGLYSTESAVGAGRVEIDGRQYEVGKTNAGALLAYRTEYYYRDNGDGTFTILYIEKLSSGENVTTVSGADIDAAASSVRELVYYKGDKKVTAKIDSDAAVIYNGTACRNYTSDVFDIDSGNVTVIGSRAVIINSYETVWVKTLDMKTYKIFPFYGEILEPDVETTEVVNAAGEKEYLVDIARFDVISVLRSADSDNIKIIRSSDSIKGKVRSVVKKGGRTYAKIGDKEYPVTKAYLNTEHSSKVDMEVGTEATFYLTAFGEIGAVGSAGSSAYRIGYITAINKQGIDDTVSMKLYDPDTQTFGIYECASKVRFDSEGTKLSGGDIENKFNDTNGEFASGIKRQLIGYTLNSDGKISAVDLASVGETGEKKQSLKLIHNFSTDGALWYRSYASCMNGKVLTGTAKVFQVSPKTDSADESDFSTINLADETTYQVEAYSLSQSSFVADYICVYPKGGKTVEQTRGFLVKDIIQTADKEGNIENALEGIILASGGTSTVERTLVIEEDCDTSGLDAGDIISADLNSKEKLMSWEYIYDYSENKFVHDDFGASIGWGNEERVVMGTVYRKSGNNVEMVIGTDATAATGHEFIIPTCFRALAMFDGEARSIDLKTFIGTMDDVTSYEDSPSEATRMICFSEWGDPRWVVFYK